MYLNNFPLTNADGVTNLEDVDFTLINHIDVIKGPASTPVSYTHLDVYKRQTMNRATGLKTNNAYVKSTISAGTASGDRISKISVSPYTTTSSTLFLGTNSGKIIKMINADTTPVSTVIATPFVGNVSDIKFGASENEILVTLSNYGETMKNVYFTNDGGATWQNKEGNLPDMPVRAIFMNPTKPSEVIIGTEMGIWGTANFAAASPTLSLIHI